MCSVMPRAISRSPMMMRFAPNFVSGACLLDEIAIFEWVWDCADEPPSTGQVCCLQKARLSRIAQHDLNTAGAKLVGDFCALLDYQKWLAIRFHPLCNETSDTSATHDHRVVLQGGDRQFVGRSGFRDSRRLRLPGPFAQPGLLESGEPYVVFGQQLQKKWLPAAFFYCIKSS
jgi:hypothetical protein